MKKNSNFISETLYQGVWNTYVECDGKWSYNSQISRVSVLFDQILINPSSTNFKDDLWDFLDQ